MMVRCDHRDKCTFSHGCVHANWHRPKQYPWVNCDENPIRCKYARNEEVMCKDTPKELDNYKGGCCGDNL